MSAHTYFGEGGNRALCLEEGHIQEGHSMIRSAARCTEDIREEERTGKTWGVATHFTASFLSTYTIQLLSVDMMAAQGRRTCLASWGYFWSSHLGSGTI